MTIKNILKKTIYRFLVILSIFVLILVALIATLFIQANYRQSEERLLASPKTGFYVEAYDTQLFLQRAGPSSAPAVIFIHGTGAWSEIWRPYMNLAVSLGYQAIALDMPPFGYSIPPKSNRYDKVSQAKRILGAMDSLGIKEATFVSHSIGSSPLMEALLTAPERVTKLIMISPALGLESPLTDGSDSKLQTWLRKRWVSESITACLFTNPLLTTKLVKNFVTEKDKVNSAWVDLYRKPFVLAGSYQAIALWLPELMARRTTLKSDNPEAYKTIPFPVVLIWGTDDQITPLSQGKYLISVIPKSELELLPGGHVPMIEEPGKFSIALRNALSRN